MPTKKITVVADTIDGAAEQIIHLLEARDNRRDVIYCQGWFGFGASAILKAVVKRLRSSDTGTGRDLGKIIHVDASQWQSKRTLQRVIAQELELPPQVMAFFDQHDEEDDFVGVEQSARGVIPYVKAAIMNELIARRFLVVLHNGSGSYIDLWEAGVPVMGQLSRRVLWTSRGRFWHHTKDGHGDNLRFDDVESAKWSDTAIFVLPSRFVEENNSILPVIRHVLYAEAEEVAKYTGLSELSMSPKIVIECILYRALRDNNYHNINWESHASNYWVCDGIIQDDTDGGRSAWEISDALQRNMSLDFCSECTGVICQILCGLHQRVINRWVSVLGTKQNSRKVQLTSQATSFFCTGGGIEAFLFEHSSKISSLRVIHLYHCDFSFSSPPFLSCSSLRFLLLDHCKDKDDTQDDGEENNSCHHHSNHSQEDGGAWFQNLWVLELSYTDWYCLLSKDILDLMVDLRELNVKGARNWSISHLHRCSGTGSINRKVLKLRVVAESYKDGDHDGAGGDRIQQVSPAVASFPDLSSWHILKTLILDGCGDLEIIDSDALPLSLEIFSLTSKDTAKIKSISFEGHTQLKSMLLRGLFDSLEELDMSGTSIKTLNLSEAHAKGLKRLFLLGCEKLHAILCPHKKKLEVLRIDTTSTLAAWGKEDNSRSYKQEASSSDNKSVGPSAAAQPKCGNNRAITSLDCYISLRDPRIFRSLLRLSFASFLHVELSSAAAASGYKGTKQGGNSDSGALIGKQQMQAVSNLYYDDDIISTFGNNSQSGGGVSNSNGDVFEAASLMRNMFIWPCPPIPEADDWPHCYISIQDDKKDVDDELLQGTRQLPVRATTLPGFVGEDSKTLHLHDSSLSITCLPGPAPAEYARDLEWIFLKWCRLERCPSLEGVVFTTPSTTRQLVINIFESLQTFWASQLLKARYIWDWSTSSAFRPGEDSFKNLLFLHLDYCARLVHVLPLYRSNIYGCRILETIEIACCGDLREVFPSDSKSQQQEEPREFPRLKRIHLHDLPKLQRICGRRMFAPSLETVKIRGCWSLKRLPAVEHRVRSTPPVVDCEKEWWDGLEWDGEWAGHHPSHYKRTYSAHYKKNQLRASVLR